MTNELREDQVRIKIGVLAVDMSEPCTGGKEMEIAFAHYGSDNICIEIDKMTYSIGREQVGGIIKMLNDLSTQKNKRFHYLEKFYTRVKAAIHLKNITYLTEEDGEILFPSDKK